MANWRQIHVDEIEDFPLMKAYTAGHWTQAQAEGFARPGEETVTHIHFYAFAISGARSIYHQIKHLIPDTVKTYSIEGM
jgi:hypothetical protein